MKNSGKGNFKRGLLVAVVIVLIVVLALLLTVTFFLNNTLGKITHVDDIKETMSQAEIDKILSETEPEDPDFVGEEMNAEDVNLPEEAVDVIETGKGVINILLVGQDNENKNVRSRTDSMILCTINKSTKTLTMTSFLRDMYVKIPGYADQRLNVAYLLGGFDMLYGSLEHNFGIVLEHGIAVNFSSFTEVIDAVGGVDVELTDGEARHLNGQNYQWSFVAGVNHLDGEAALAYSRIRRLDNDFNRTGRQRIVMMALLEKAKTLPLTDLYKLVETVIPMVVTDMDSSEIVNLAIELAPLLKDLTIVSQRIPADGEYYFATIDGMSVIVPDIEANRQLLVDSIGTE